MFTLLKQISVTMNSVYPCCKCMVVTSGWCFDGAEDGGDCDGAEDGGDVTEVL